MEVRLPRHLEHLNALIIPGGESTTMAIVAKRNGLLEPLRDFVLIKRLPVWGTCAGAIMLTDADKIFGAKIGGQESIGGFNVPIRRNAFGSQVDSFMADVDLQRMLGAGAQPFRAVFIRAPLFEIGSLENSNESGVVEGPDADANNSRGPSSKLKVLATVNHNGVAGAVVLLKQNVFATVFHPELTDDARIHAWFVDFCRNFRVS